jgi:hypothetical protein
LQQPIKASPAGIDLELAVVNSRWRPALVEFLRSPATGGNRFPSPSFFSITGLLQRL